MTKRSKQAWRAMAAVATVLAVVLAVPWSIGGSDAARKGSGRSHSLKRQLDAVMRGYPGSSIVSLDEKRKFVTVALDERIGCISEECSKMTGELAYKIVSADRELIILLKFANGDSFYVDYAEAKRMYQTYRGGGSTVEDEEEDAGRGPDRRISEELVKRGIKEQ